MNNMTIYALIAETSTDYIGMELGDALRHMFTDDPINWLKFALVFATFIVGFIIVLPIYKKVEYFISRERKRDIALSRGHVIDAKLLKS